MRLAKKARKNENWSSKCLGNETKWKWAKKHKVWNKRKRRRREKHTIIYYCYLFTIICSMCAHSFKSKMVCTLNTFGIVHREQCVRQTSARKWNWHQKLSDENKQKKENDHYAVKIKFMNKNIETPMRKQESMLIAHLIGHFAYLFLFCFGYFLLWKIQHSTDHRAFVWKTMRKLIHNILHYYFRLISLFIIVITDAIKRIPNSVFFYISAWQFRK